MARKAKTEATEKHETANLTPLMAQYFKVKTKYPDAILLFRVGDFYETFGEDAVTASRVLGIVLTARNNGGSDIELAGFPYHSMDLYLPRLVRAGYRVAICEQMEKPSPQKKIVRREVTEVVTPGIAIDDQLLDHKTNNYLAAVCWQKDAMGVAFLDISTGEFLVSEGEQGYIDKLLQSFQPAEVLFAKNRRKDFERWFGEKFYTFPIDEWVFTEDYTREKLLTHFEVQTLKGFGVEEFMLAQMAAGAILHYLSVTENKNLRHVNSISRIQPDRYVWLDRFTIRNLELLHSPHETGVPLIKILDCTVSPMGARLLKKWVVLPLKSQKAIEERLDMVGYFRQQPEIALEMEKFIRQMGDLERLISKAPLGKLNPREVVQLKRALHAIEPVKKRLLDSGNPWLMKTSEGLNPCQILRETIERQVVEEAPVNLHKGGVIADGFHAELDELRNIVHHTKDLLLGIQQEEVERTGIASLKIGFNTVFGYYLEVTNKYKNQVPPEWTRKQTLTNAERYITDELKRLETKILGAEERILTLEAELFEQLVLTISDYIQPIQHNAHLIARLDCLMAFARLAEKYQYCRPEINDSLIIDIRQGRHPVIEQQLELGEAYVPNDVYLDSEDQQILMITGPNMSGKSAVLRQTALICLMAQMGCFVPAASARLGLLDKVFTRVGASDNISSGESTFMVEMNETASIMNNVSDRSLILLDEIGRGTSTYDGISIAWSIAEFLHNNGLARPKTLFATHYHELNELAERFPRIRNYNIATKEVGQKVIFLRKLVAGGSQHSFGIHVAKMAGMPRSIVERAAEILTQLEQKVIENGHATGTPKAKRARTKNLNEPMQLSIFEAGDPRAEQLKAALLQLDVNSMTPIDCMMKLQELKQLAQE
ncbi:MAG TPA: DNA mismatch repair protein MutS [Saprospiraceae bacterium]|nr:DNA mismatch repair protein MutS [Saprospiraceae bacterium]HMP25996.1 DNA mismatch repair protein MutS [Saprospiraceae bacterium]